VVVMTITSRLVLVVGAVVVVDAVATDVVTRSPPMQPTASNTTVSGAHLLSTTES
jgi:hypothetical protein